jgi:hypothetical protein
VQLDNDKILFRVYCRPSETECQTSDKVPAVSTKLGMTEVNGPSVDFCASATNHSEGAKQIQKLHHGCMAQARMRARTEFPIYSL